VIAAVGAVIAVIAALGAVEAPTGGEFCWDPLPGARTFVLYQATPGPPGVEWSELARVSAAEACAAGSSCCARFADAPGNLVYYIVRGEP